MAKRIEGPYDFTRYGFSRFNDGATWELTGGEDFTVSPQTIASNARKWAQNEGLQVDVKVVPEEPTTPAVVALRFRKRSMRVVDSA